MLVPYKQIQRFVDFDLYKVLPIKELSEGLAEQGLEVEDYSSTSESISESIEEIDFSKYNVGEIQKIEAHPNADRLSLCSVLCLIQKEEQVFRVVCGAKNMKEGDKVCLARIGAMIPRAGIEKNSQKAKRQKLTQARIRGVESEGMLCSLSELGFEKESLGIWILPSQAKIRDSISKYLPQPNPILKLSPTANRGDCLSLLGTAREVSTLVSQKTKKIVSIQLPKIDISNDPDIKIPQISIPKTDFCKRYSSRIIRGVHIGESPDWLKSALLEFDARPINNVVDISNFVLFELGHPSHIFDLSKLAGEKIIVRRAKKNEILSTIDGIKRTLYEGCPIIADETNPLAIAGIMGGEDSRVSENTTDLLLEAAYFLPEEVRKTSKNYSLITEASVRFERGVDVETTVLAIDRCASLIQEICGGKVSELVDVYPEPIPAKTIELRTSFVREKLGIPIQEKEILHSLHSLQCQTEKKGDLILVKVPTFKTDVDREIDLVEEIIRVYGYSHISETLAPLHINRDMLEFEDNLSESLRVSLSSLGLSEVLNYSFNHSNHHPKDQSKNSSVVVQTKNPLGKDSQSLRDSLFFGLLKNIIYNFYHGIQSVGIFELGHVFYRENHKEEPKKEAKQEIIEEPKEKVIERNHLALALFGLAQERSLYSNQRVFDFFDLKGIVEEILDRMFLFSGYSNGFSFESPISFQPLNPNLNPSKNQENQNSNSTNLLSESLSQVAHLLHPNQSLMIHLKNQNIGVLGQLSPELVLEQKLPHPIFFCEIDLDHLVLKNYENPKRYREFSKFPEVLRDLAIVIPEDVPMNSVQKQIRSKLLREVHLLDIYRSKPIPDGQKSLAFSLHFQSPDRTLSDQEVEKEWNRILKRLEIQFSARLRDF